MSEHLDREFQRRVLTELAAAYPETLQPSHFEMEQDDRRWVVNVSYLYEHNLVTASTTTMQGPVRTLVLQARATAEGLDFLEADGGLGAILNVTTVRFEAETLKAIIGEHIESSALPAPEKSKLKAWLHAAGTEALKEATKRLMGAALEQAPSATQLLQMLRG